MRVLSLIAAVCVAAGGSASAQQLYQSRLSYPQTRYPLSRVVRDVEPPTVPVSEAAEGAEAGNEMLRQGGHDHSGHGNCGMGECRSCCCCGPTWFGSVGGLYMSREENDDIELTTPGIPGGELIELMNVNSASQNDWETGFEVTVGRHLNCRSRVAVTYWTLDPVEGSASVYDAGSTLVSSFNWDGLDFGVNPVGASFDGVQLHSVSRRSEFHNFEVNYWRDCPRCCCDRLHLSGMTGFRYFRFDEDFTFSADDPATYAVGVENSMIGWQFGGRADYQATCGLSLFADVRFGIFYNDIEHRTTLQDSTGAFATDAYGREWNINSQADDFSTLAQLDLGGRWQVGCNWSVYGGYRLVAASGVALATEQIPFYIADYSGIANVDTTGDLFLHGFFGGVEFTR